MCREVARKIAPAFVPSVTKPLLMKVMTHTDSRLPIYVSTGYVSTVRSS